MAYQITRIPRREIIERSVEAIMKNMQQEPRFPKVREIFEGIELITSFSHASLSPWSSQLVGNAILKEIATSLHIPDEKILNLIYDNAVPSADWAPGGHRLDIGLLPRIFDGDKPYSSGRHAFRRINFKELSDSTVSAFPDGFSKVVEERMSDVITILDRYEKNLSIVDGIIVETYEIRNLAEAILQSRRNTFEVIGMDNVNETLLSSTSGKVAGALRILEYEYNLPFYNMPLSEFYYDASGNKVEGFAPAGYLKGIDRNGIRRPVSIDTGEGKPVFTYIDEYTYSSDGSGTKRSLVTDKKTVRLKGDEVYDAIENRSVVPTVPVLLLASTTGAQIPHMGAFNWRDYAPSELRRQAAFLGLKKTESDQLYLCTEGYNSFGVIRNEKLFTGTFSGLISFGKDEIQKMLRGDDYAQVHWGELYSGAKRQ